MSNFAAANGLGVGGNFDSIWIKCDGLQETHAFASVSHIRFIPVLYRNQITVMVETMSLRLRTLPQSLRVLSASFP